MYYGSWELLNNLRVAAGEQSRAVFSFDLTTSLGAGWQGVTLSDIDSLETLGRWERGSQVAAQAP